MSQRIGFLLLDVIAGDLHVIHEGCMSANQYFVVEADIGELMEEGEPKIICPIIAEGKADDGAFVEVTIAAPSKNVPGSEGITITAIPRCERLSSTRFIPSIFELSFASFRKLAWLN